MTKYCEIQWASGEVISFDDEAVVIKVPTMFSFNLITTRRNHVFNDYSQMRSELGYKLGFNHMIPNSSELKIGQNVYFYSIIFPTKNSYGY